MRTIDRRVGVRQHRRHRCEAERCRQTCAAAIHAQRPRAGPHERSVELVPVAVDRKPRHGLFGGAARGSNGPVLAGWQCELAQRERRVGRDIGGVALQARHPVNRSVRQCRCECVEVRQLHAS